MVVDKPLVVGIGEVLWDILPEGKKPGGAPANCIYHLSRMGCDAYTISSVGDDKEGRELLEILNANGINTDYITIHTGYPTGTVSVELDAEGNPDYTIHENVAWDGIIINAGIKSLVQKSQALCFGSLAQRNIESKRVINEIINLCPENCIKFFDVNLRQEYYDKEILSSSLEKCNVLKINEEELSVMTGMFNLPGNNPEALTSLFNLFDLSLIALTKGPEASILYDGKSTSIIKPPAVKAIDTVGAGDSFSAALIAGLLKNLDLKKIHRNAIAVSAWLCTCSGATPDYDLTQIKKFKLF